MPVTPCQPCWLLLTLLAMPDTPCRPCWLLLASHAGYFLPCQPCQLLLASHAGYSLPCRPCRLLLTAMPVTHCQPCWLLLALPAMPVTSCRLSCRPCWLLLAGHAGTTLCWPCLLSNQLWMVALTSDFEATLEYWALCLIYRSANSSLVSCSLFCDSTWLGTASS